MYNIDDIERLLVESREHQEQVISKIPEVAHGTDALILERAVRDTDFVAEDFDRYDSDVCEQFLQLMERTILSREQQPMVHRHRGR